MNLYQNQFSSKHNFPFIEETSKILIIASTARSGSHMLGHSLYKTGSFGFPLEYANPTNVPEWMKRLKTNTFIETLNRIQRIRTSPNGVFSIKIHYSHLKTFGGFNKLIQIFPNARFILLSRNDILRQAVSLSFAKKTGVWISGQKPKNVSPTYSYKHVDQCLREIICKTASWKYKLASSGSTYIELSFEEVQKDLNTSIRRIANFMDIELVNGLIPNLPPTKKQHSIKKNEWIDKFTSESDPLSELFERPHNHLLKLFNKLIYRIK